MTGIREARCERTDLPESMCAHCRKSEEDWPVRDVAVGLPFEASYPGTCVFCGGRFDAGTLIAQLIPFGSGWVCEECQP